MSRPARLEHVVAPPERDIQAAVLELLQRHPAVAYVWRANSGVTHYIDRFGHERWIRFGFRGCPDILGFLRGTGRFLAVECKSEQGELTKDQALFLEAVSGGGGLAICARSVDDVMAALEAA